MGGEDERGTGIRQKPSGRRVTQAEVLAVVFRFYGQDPIDMSWGRTLALYNSIRKVEDEFRPKTPIELGLAMAEEEARARKAEEEKRKRDAQWQISDQ